jgi:alpha-tubulin suppressor-like RCC1 family protein
LSRDAAIGMAALATGLAAVSPGMPAFAAVSARHLTVARTTGVLLAWGQNNAGQLGDGTMTNRDTPVRVKLPRGTKVIQARAGCFFTVALTSTGEVLAWGLNLDGQLGDGSMLNSMKPVRVHIPAHTRIVQVRAGCAFALARTSTGQVLAWGLNDVGQLGDGRAVNAMAPTRVRLPRHTVVTGVSAGAAFGLALTSTGAVLAWGDNSDGQLGDGGTTSTNVPVKVKLPRAARVRAVSAGGFFSLAQTSTGGVLAWGQNNLGQLGDDSTTGSDRPVKVKLPAGTKVAQMFAGGTHALVLTSKGRVLAWGNNGSGQLGTGNTNNSDVPVKVLLPPGTKATGIASCLNNSFALTSKGRALAWGDEIFGELGNGVATNTPLDLPVSVKLPAGVHVSAVSCGPEASVGLAIER